MKSFIFATSYIDSSEAYEKRYLKWINYYKGLPFTEDKPLFLMDDGSPEEFISDFPGKLIKEDEIDDNYKVPQGKDWLEDVNMFHFNERIGIEPRENNPHLGGSTLGWYRSFFNSVKIALKFKFDKIIHIESDAYLISKKVCDFIDHLDSGWTTLYCPKYTFPETSIQIICKDNFDKLEILRKADINEFKEMQAEWALPITQFTKSFVGDRYGESTELQLPSIDYYCQCNLNTNLKYKG
tara:strand:+ start:673 stop:1389 length:717 start_codon:yes stop_codon:yes gene_type:complete